MELGTLSGKTKNMKYTLTITPDDTASVWPDLAQFNGRVFKRRDFAKYMLRCAMYEALKGRSLLDRPVAEKAMKWVDDLIITNDSDHTYIFAGLTFNLKSSK